MSRSRRKTPIFGHTRAESDKQFKVAENRRSRRANNQRIDDVPPQKAYGDPWKSDKDGKSYWRDAPPSMMRK